MYPLLKTLLDYLPECKKWIERIQTDQCGEIVGYNFERELTLRPSHKEILISFFSELEKELISTGIDFDDIELLEKVAAGADLFLKGDECSRVGVCAHVDLDRYAGEYLIPYTDAISTESRDLARRICEGEEEIPEQGIILPNWANGVCWITLKEALQEALYKVADYSKTDDVLDLLGVSRYSPGWLVMICYPSKYPSEIKVPTVIDSRGYFAWRKNENNEGWNTTINLSDPSYENGVPEAVHCLPLAIPNEDEGIEYIKVGICHSTREKDINCSKILDSTMENYPLP